MGETFSLEESVFTSGCLEDEWDFASAGSILDERAIERMARLLRGYKRASYTIARAGALSELTEDESEPKEKRPTTVTDPKHETPE